MNNPAPRHWAPRSARQLLALATGLLSILTGLLYASRWWFPAVEQEVAVWGLWAILAGLLSLLAARLRMRAIGIRAIALIGYSILIFAQVLPVWLWWNLTLLTDSPEGEIGTRLYALPHLLIMTFGIATIAALIVEQRRTNN